MWHSDAGPGTCINVMFCLNETDEHNGAMEFVPWDASIRIFVAERLRNDLSKLQSSSAIENRSRICNFYESVVDSR